MKDFLERVLYTLRSALHEVVEFLLLLVKQKLLWIAVSVCLTSFILVICLKKIRRRKASLLTTEIKEEIRRLSKKKRLHWFRSLVEHIYIPSWKSFFSVIFLLLPFIVLSHFACTDFLGKIIQIENNILVSILVAFGVIIFALIMFIAEGMRESNTTDRGRTLLKESRLYPLFVGEVIVLMSFLFGKVNTWAIIPVFLIGCLLIYSLSQMLMILLSKSLFGEKRVQMLMDRIKKSMMLAMEERIGDNLLLSHLNENDILLKYNPFPLDEEKNDYHLFSVSGIGVIDDIRLDKLREFSMLVENKANEKGYSFIHQKALPETQTASEDTSITSLHSPKVYKALDKHLLVRKFRDPIVDTRQPILCVHREAIKDERILRRLDRIASECFVIKNKKSYSEEISQELEALNDDFISAIIERKLGKIKEFKKSYTRIADAFIEMFSEIGGVYSFEEARKERTNFLGGWNEVRWLTDAISDAIETACTTNELSILEEVAFLPLAITIRSLNGEDHYIFQQFIIFPSRLYMLSKKITDDSVRNSIIDRTSRQIVEIAQYYIEPELRNVSFDSKKIDCYEGFAVQIFFVFQELLRFSYLENDITNFKVFLERQRSLYKRFLSDRDIWRINHSAEMNVNSIDEIQKRLSQKKQQSLFGLAAWILEKLSTDIQQSSEAKKVFLDLLIDILPHEIVKLTSLYLSVRSHDVEEFWGWSSWDMVFDGEIRAIDRFGNMDRLYCVKSLQILEGMADDAADSIDLPYNREIAHLTEEKGALSKILDDIDSNSEKWSRFLTQVASEKVNMFRSLLEKAREKQLKEERDFLASSELSPKRIEEFKKTLQERFHDFAILRPLFNRYGMIVDRSKSDEIPPKLKMYGYDQVTDKGAFIEDWHVSYSDSGGQFGEGLALSEDQFVFKSIVKELEKKRTVGNEGILKEITSELEDYNYENPILLLNIQYTRWHEMLYNTNALVEKWKSDRNKTVYDDFNGYQGHLLTKRNHIPVFSLRITRKEVPECVLLISPRRVGKWYQYPPIWRQEDKKNQVNIFMVEIVDLNKDENMRTQIVENNEWAKEYKEDDTYLRQKVVIKVYEKYAFSVIDKKAGCLFGFQDNKASDSPQ